jgi:tellurite resistance protein TerC
MSHPWLWIGLFVVLVTAVAADLGVHRHQHRPLGLRAAAGWSLAWIALAVGYGALVWWRRGGDRAAEFYTAWLLEKSLSFDNLLVFLLLFNRLEVPAGERHRVLTWGIFGALVLRAIMIFGGIELLRRWHPIVYVFGAFLAYTGLRTLLGRDQAPMLLEQRWVRGLRRILPLVPRFDGGHFFTVENGRRAATLLLFALVVVELSDLLFAVDSIPAVIGVTSDPQIVFSSNALALLGLRALYLVIEQLMARLRFLHVGIGLILILVGAKMCLGAIVAVPPWLALAATLLILTATVVVSRLRPRRPATDRAPPPPARHAAPDARACAPAPPAAEAGRS